jgi:hypothetical protein
LHAAEVAALQQRVAALSASGGSAVKASEQRHAAQVAAMHATAAAAEAAHQEALRKVRGRLG